MFQGGGVSGEGGGGGGGRGELKFINQEESIFVFYFPLDLNCCIFV